MKCIISNENYNETIDFDALKALTEEKKKTVEDMYAIAHTYDDINLISDILDYNITEIKDKDSELYKRYISLSLYGYDNLSESDFFELTPNINIYYDHDNDYYYGIERNENEPFKLFMWEITTTNNLKVIRNHYTFNLRYID